MGYASAKSIGSGQPVHSAQADLRWNFSLFVNFLCVRGPVYVMIMSVDKVSIMDL